VVGATWGASGPGADAPLRRVTQRAALDAMLDLAGSAAATADVRAAVEARLERLDATLAARAGTAADRAHHATARRDIRRYLEGNDDRERRPRPAPIPLPWP
jgi:hypothetical protein